MKDPVAAMGVLIAGALHGSFPPIIQASAAQTAFLGGDTLFYVYLQSAYHH